MNGFEYVCLATEKAAGDWFNVDPFRFAVQPYEDETHQREVATKAEALVSTYRTAECTKVRGKILDELFDMHASEDLLWPAYHNWGGSCLGPIQHSRYVLAVAEVDRGFAGTVLKLTSEPEFRYKHAQQSSERATLAWKILAAVRFASGMGSSWITNFESAHFQAFAAVAKPGGIWSPSMPKPYQRALLRLSSCFGRLRQDPSFIIARVMNGRGGSAKRNKDVSASARHLSWLEQSYDRYVSEKNVTVTSNYRHGIRLLRDYYVTRSSSDYCYPEAAFERSILLGMLEFAQTWSTPGTRLLAASQVREYLMWFQLNMVDESGECTPDALAPVDFERFARKVAAETPRLPQGEVSARPMPTQYHTMLKEIITADDFAWPKSLKYRNGRRRFWMRIKDPETGNYDELFCPVLPRLLLLMLDIPLRLLQARRLDSGEGDSRRWDPVSGKWEAATGFHAGYWDRQPSVRNPRRGVLREMPTRSGGTITGLYVNSNKMMDAKTLFNEMSGYEIPWEHPEVLLNLAAMREWQERYNPVAGPLAYEDIPKGILPVVANDTIRGNMPARFYLFRYPGNGGERGHEAPPTHEVVSAFFFEALDELESRLNSVPGENPVRIITQRTAWGVPTVAVFSMHGMRSSTLTALHVAGVPIEILSKVVAGHASILMTLRYLKFDPLHVSDVLTAGRLKAVAEGRTAFPGSLSQASFDQARKMTARLSDDGLQQMYGPVYSESSGWTSLEIGLCPNGCTLCHIGGEKVGILKGTGQHRAVPGIRNCLRCRFFVTGLPFLIPLWAHGTNLLAKADGHARGVAEREGTVRALKAERMSHVRAGAPADASMRERIQMAEDALAVETERRNHALTDFHATMTMIEMVRAISAEPAADGTLPMLMSADEIPEVVGRESTRFEVTDAVVQASRFFPTLQSDELDRERDAFLDNILHRNGYVPITLAPLSQAEKRRAADAMSQMLLVQIGAKEAQKLIEGQSSLDDYDLQGRLQDICLQAIGRPVPGLTQQGPVARTRTPMVIAAE